MFDDSTSREISIGAIVKINNCRYEGNYIVVNHLGRDRWQVMKPGEDKENKANLVTVEGNKLTLVAND